ncbi:cellulose synthase operon protein YhjQ/BcsQ [Terriglobus roseus]|uniref:Cellulose synthase operon protein YhjQ n=1 Tax=Terriglobus roseus TaxID=392734 RepID=A0A1G7JP77_9BACT|nr:cellulose synthase operon protein YhjQ/BcsQ [Terriglobus roseus]SDF26681.1 cellulose synthase operon protein YhjQ [Terriglobus roseus]
MNPAEDERQDAPETPEDVAVLYTWANVHGGKYRDFSAERREHRALQRHRMVEAQRQAELDAAQAMEEAAVRELEEARRHEQEVADNEAARQEAEEARRLAEERASRERQAAQRHVETAENLKRALQDAEREMEEARRHVEQQAARYAEADARYRNSTRENIPGEIEDPYYYAGHLEPTAFAPGKGVRSSVPQRVSSERRITENYYRSKGSAEMPAAAGTERSPYTENYAYPDHRTDTPEDAHERRRPDEQERLHRPSEMRAQDIDDHGYYDHKPEAASASAIPRSPSDLNSAPGDLYIPPRVPGARPSSASAERAVRSITRPVDPEPGNTHVLDTSRVRRRESATDISARTTRHSRQEPARRDSDVSEAGEYAADSQQSMRRLPTDVRRSDSNPVFTIQGEPARSSEERPEWLGRDARDSAEVPSYQDRRESPAAGFSETQRIEAASDDRAARDVRQPAPEYVAEREVSQPRSASSDVANAPTARPSSDTLQQSRERVAARWFALKGLVGSETHSEPAVPARSKDVPVPTLCVMSLAGGVGKTSMVATVARTLSSMGERVLLADVTPHGLLPYYFGANELRPDVVRTFSPPPGSKAAPVFMVNYQAERLNGNDEGQADLLDEISRHAHGTQRVLLDLNSASAWLGRRLASEKQAKILVPITPDMNSVLGIKNMERFFAGTQDTEGRPVRPYYVLNQFDASLPLHLDVREVLRQQLGDRLLPVMIRRSPAVSEALAEGMTVMDYAPESPVAEDYMHLAEWARNLAAPAQNSMRSIRWSER